MVFVGTLVHLLSRTVNVADVPAKLASANTVIVVPLLAAAGCHNSIAKMTAQKLAGSTWGSNGNTLRTAALGLLYPTSEYCCPVWLRSAHILANIAPPEIRREAALAQWEGSCWAKYFGRLNFFPHTLHSKDICENLTKYRDVIYEWPLVPCNQREYERTQKLKNQTISELEETIDFIQKH
ncbi:hypothetical protein Bhyg_08991 [Pseudolycoriella hygida]|uniref:Uncharacterized protein n=1 Tax=Pseudolycoriella hygida TaxID=35572 RepID=A0A9Q0S5G9_9DIPT|nr:hypothetical protein Bhyg_08991 [Pseudolycoriella hygida]